MSNCARCGKELEKGEVCNCKLKVTLDARNLENVKNTFKVINNKVFTQKGEFTPYDMELLDALLGENWVNEYAVGKTYMRIWSY